MCVCSGTHSDSKPRSSIARASGAGCMDAVVKNMTAPIFMLQLLRVHAMAELRRFRAWEPTRARRVVVSIRKEITMKPISSIIVARRLWPPAWPPARCRSAPTTRVSSMPTLRPPRPTTARQARTVVATTPAPAYYSYDQPSFQKSNVYSSRCGLLPQLQGHPRRPRADRLLAQRSVARTTAATSSTAVSGMCAPIGRLSTVSASFSASGNDPLARPRSA